MACLRRVYPQWQTLKARLCPVGSTPIAHAPQDPDFGDFTLVIDIGDVVSADLLAEDLGESIVMLAATAELVVQEVVVLAVEIPRNFQDGAANPRARSGDHSHYLSLLCTSPPWLSPDWRPGIANLDTIDSFFRIDPRLC